ncbi:MAG: DNA repair protein RadC [Muribaculaceae bacterium]|nr:DNA repair protein RadC [Muribaculaceae bacterium]
MEDKFRIPEHENDLPQKAGPRIRDLSEDEKPREKALKQGFDTLTDTELLALLLGTGVPGKSVIDLAREILRDNDNKLRVLSRRSVQDLMRTYKGMGPAKATLLVAAMTFGARCQTDLGVKDPQMASSRDVYTYMRSHLERLNYEEFWILHLNRANRVQYAERMGKGGLAATYVDARLIAKSAIDHLSSALILVHNHPSGNLQPSASDDSVTRKIKEVCQICEISVQDHIIIGPSGYYSYRDEGRVL